MATTETDNNAEGNYVYSAKHLVLAVAILATGTIIGVSASAYLPPSFGNYKKGYQAGFSAAKNLVLNNPVSGLFKTSEDIRSIRGIVTAVNGETVTLHLSLINPFDDQTLNDRLVTINTSTQIVKLAQKDIKTVTAELDAFNESLMASTSSNKLGVTPSFFTTTSAKFGDITTGSSVTVITSENVKNLKSFSANEVQIMPK